MGHVVPWFPSGSSRTSLQGKASPPSWAFLLLIGAPGVGKHLEPHPFPYWLCKCGCDTSLSSAKWAGKDGWCSAEPEPSTWLLIKNLPVVILGLHVYTHLTCVIYNPCKGSRGEGRFLKMRLGHQDGSRRLGICTLFPHGLGKTVKMYLTLERAQSHLAPSAAGIQDLGLDRGLVPRV